MQGFPNIRVVVAATSVLLATGHAGEEASESGKRFRPTLSATGEVWQDVHGGAATGGWWNSLVDLRGELDGPALGAPRSGTFVAEVHWVTNRGGAEDFAATTGAFTPVSGIMANDHVRIFNLHYRHTAPDQSWAFKIGQLAIDDDFMVSDYAALFANSAFGAMPSQVATPLCSECRSRAAYPVYGVAAPGVWVEWTGTSAVTCQAGIYLGDPGEDRPENHGFSWTFSDHGGTAVFTETIWHPRQTWWTTSRIGISGHTGRLDDMSHPDAPAGTKRGLVSLYSVQDFILARATNAEPKLGAFVRIGTCPQSDRTAVRAYADAGFNWFDPFGRGSKDVAGVGASTTRFHHGFQSASGLPATETTLEVTYRVPLTRHWCVQADLQALFHPAPNFVSGRRETAIVCGIRTVMTL